jgi:hypothetical protein
MDNHFYNRFAFSYREWWTAVWIYNELAEMGHPYYRRRMQSFYYEDVRRIWPMPMMGITYLLDGSPFVNMELRANRVSQNVILTVPGRSDEIIVVGAHYDAVMFPGASDNASGVALLLESAKRILDADNYYTIKYVFFGAEEVGLFGAYYFASSLSDEEHENIKFVINADVLLEGEYLFFMGGYDADSCPDRCEDCVSNAWRRISIGLNFGTGGVLNSGANYITDTWDSVAAEVSANYGVNLVPWADGIFSPSDNLAFLPWGHTVLVLMGLDKPGEWHDINEMESTFLTIAMAFMDMGRVLHSPRDNFEYINKRWPGKMDENMRGFSIFLEEILLADYGG